MCELVYTPSAASGSVLVLSDGDETLDLLTKTSGAREAVSHIRKVAELTHARAV